MNLLSKLAFTAIFIFADLAFSDEFQLAIDIRNTTRTNEVVWITRGNLPDDWDGVYLKRKRSDAEPANWESLHKELIKPTSIHHTNWSLVSAKPLKNDNLKALLESQVKLLVADEKNYYADVILRIKEDDIMSGKVGAYFRNGQWSFLCEKVIGNYPDTAFFIGMGFIDNSIEKGQSYMYGLFPVYKGKVAEKPLVTSVPRADLTKLGIKPTTMGVKWRKEPETELFIEVYYSSSDANNLGIKWLQIEESVPDKNKLVPITVVKENGQLKNKISFFHSLKEEKDREVILKFTPITIFGDKLKELATIYHHKPKK